MDGEVSVPMQELKLVLQKIDEIRADVSEMKADHKVLSAVNEEQHGFIKETLSELSDNIAKQNGRVTRMEKWQDKVKTQMRTVPTVISVIATGSTMLITWLAFF